VQIFKYVVPIANTSLFPLENNEINHLDSKIPNNKNTINIQILKNIPFPATLFTFSLFFLLNF